MLQNNSSVCPVCSFCNVCVLWPNIWMDQYATWYGGRPRPRRHCIRWGPSSALPMESSRAAPSFRAVSIVAKQSPISATAELLLTLEKNVLLYVSVWIWFYVYTVIQKRTGPFYFCCNLDQLFKFFRWWTLAVKLMIKDVTTPWSTLWYLWVQKSRCWRTEYSKLPCKTQLFKTLLITFVSASRYYVHRCSLLQTK